MPDKKEQIISLQQQKAAIYPDLAILNKEYQKIRQAFYQKEQSYMALRRKYEALDREEKLLTFVKPQKLTTTTTRKKPANMVKTKNAALKALANLPAELRAQILKNFSKG